MSLKCVKYLGCTRMRLCEVGACERRDGQMWVMLLCRFTYQLLQGYDFVHLNRAHGVRLQVKTTACASAPPNTICLAVPQIDPLYFWVGLLLTGEGTGCGP